MQTLINGADIDLIRSLNIYFYLRAGIDFSLASRVTYRVNNALYKLHLVFEILLYLFPVGLRPRRFHDGLAFVRHGLPDLFCDKGHERVKKPQCFFQSIGDYELYGLTRRVLAFRRYSHLGVLYIHPGFGQFYIPVAEFVPDKII